jgi:purine-binding chemotaxis protein CheW
MKSNSYLIVQIKNRLYGISTPYVEEIFNLPELTPIATIYPDIVGVINLRGDSLPVIDLNLSFGHQSPDYCLTDSVVVLRWQELRVGLIVNQVREPKTIAPEEIAIELEHGQKVVVSERKKIIAGIASNTENILIINNPKNWFQQIDIKQLISTEFGLEHRLPQADTTQSNSPQLLLNKLPVFCPTATPEERAIFRDRADHLKLSIESQDLKDLIPIAVVALKGHLFGIDLAMVREFTDIRSVTPMPCCPTHIVGNMNLRGEILTLVDISKLFNLPSMGMYEGSKAMIVEVEEIVVGVVVEAVRDVMFFLDPLEIKANSIVIDSMNEEYLQGVASYQEERMSIVNLQKVFLKGGLIVDEAI